MEFTVQSKQFYSILSSVGRVINSKNALQILDNFLVTVKDGRVTVTGMDVENLLSGTMEVSDCVDEGSFCVNASRMTELFKEIPDQGVKIAVDERLNIHIEFMSGELDFAAIPAVEYPEYEKESESDGEPPVTFTAMASQFVRGIENTLFATGDDEFRLAMMGIFTEVRPNGITFVATDTRKLVVYNDCRHRPGATASAILPPKPANVLKNIFSGDEIVNVTMTSRSAEFSNDTYVFNCRFIMSQFPPYERVIPKSNNFVLTVDRQALANAVRRVGLSCDKGYNLEKFRILSDHLIIKAEDANLMTRSREQMPCSFTGDELTIGFGGTHLIEILNVLKGQDITIKLGDAARPGIFEPIENDPDTSLLILLMPMTVGEF